MTAPVLLVKTGDTSPGANSQATGTLAVVSGNSYLIGFHQNNTSSTNPNAATVTGTNGWNTTITEITGMGQLFTTTGTTRRRFQVFKVIAVSNTSGVLTFTYTGVTPTVCDWFVLNMGVTGPAVIVSGSEQISAVPHTSTAVTLDEAITLNAAASSRNYPIALCAGNTNNATNARFELDADKVGSTNSQDWTTEFYGSSSTAARTVMAGWRADFADLTPGVFFTPSTVTCISAGEVEQRLLVVATMAASVTSSGDMTGALEVIATMAASVTSSGDMTLANMRDATMASDLGTLTAAMTAVTEVVATMASSSTSSATLTGDLEVIATMASSAPFTATLTGDLEVIATAAASVTFTGVLTGDLEVIATMAASVTSSATLTGDLEVIAVLASSTAFAASMLGTTDTTLAAPIAFVAVATAVVERSMVLDAPLGTLTGSMTAVTEVVAVLAAPLGSLTAAMTATTQSTFASSSDFTAVATAVVTHPAVLASSTPFAAVMVGTTQTTFASLTTFAGSMVAVVEVIATMASSATSSGSLTAVPEVTAVLATTFGSLVSIATATVVHPAVLASSFGALTASMTASAIIHPAVLAALSVFTGQIIGIVNSAALIGDPGTCALIMYGPSVTLAMSADEATLILSEA